MITRFARLAAGALAAGALLSNAGAALAQMPTGDPNTIVMQGRQFVAAQVTVPAGTTLTWVNMDDVEHDVIAGDSSFASEVLAPGGSFMVTFTAPGTFKYLCDLHANMEGTVEVVAGG